MTFRHKREKCRATFPNELRCFFRSLSGNKTAIFWNDGKKVNSVRMFEKVQMTKMPQWEKNSFGLSWDLELQRDLKSLATTSSNGSCYLMRMFRATRKFLYNQFLNLFHQFLQLASEAITLYIVHPNEYLPNIYTTVWYLFIFILHVTSVVCTTVCWRG